jgi:hypothetical protein
MRSMRALVVACAVVSSACGLAPCANAPTPTPTPPPTPTPVGPPPGGCVNLDFDGTCTFQPPMQTAEAGVPGNVVYELRATCVSGANSLIDTVAHLAIPAERAQELETHYMSHAAVPCHCYIVRPPCDPSASAITLDVDAPAFATVTPR